MKRRSLITVGIVVAVVLAGCSGSGLPGSSSTTEKSTTLKPVESTQSTTAETTTTTAKTTETTTAADTTTAAGTTASAETNATTTAESWSEPTPPNKPLQDKRNGSDDRIKNVTIVKKNQSGDGGYSDFDVKVTADTRMANVDPADHGTVRGEPYFVVYVHNSLEDGGRFKYISGDLIARSSVSQDQNGEYTIEIEPEALEQAGVKKGKVKLMVMLMDKDSEWDDIYGVANATVKYSPGK